MNPLWWILTRLSLDRAFPCSTLLCALIPLLLFWVSLSSALLSFLLLYLCWRPSAFFIPKSYDVFLLPHGVRTRIPFLICTKFFGTILSIMCFDGMVFFSQLYQSYQVETISPSSQSCHHRVPYVIFFSQRPFASLMRHSDSFSLSTYETRLHIPSCFYILG